MSAVVLPRVTAILQMAGLAPDFSAVPPELLEAARARGSAVHAAIEGDHYGYETDVPPDAAPYLDAYRKFVAESKHEPLHSEIEVVHRGWRYCGHPDRIGFLLGKRLILDWKTTESLDLRYAGRQLTGYRLAWNAMHPTEPVEGLAVLQLKSNGTYRLHEITSADHEQVFLAAVVLYHARTEPGR